MEVSSKLLQAFELFDEANEQDPNKEIFQGKTCSKEVLYAIRMTEMLNEYVPDASEPLKLATRCQHICRWEIPRESYEMDRAGYLKWRQDLKKFHVEKASGILREVGYEQKTIDKVSFLLEKKQLKKNKETQALEDVICLVFLEFYFEPFLEKHSEEKLVDILQKTWRKMSKKGHEMALKIPYTKTSLNLIQKALNG
ncbi:MAG: hypothetical protein ACI815_001255 [Psychroserpens sp.]|jgi:hypothetical protein